MSEDRPEFIKAHIGRCLCQSGSKPYILTAYPHKVKKSYEKFSTLADLKSYYNIKKITKSGEGWAINSKGNKITWIEYDTEISKWFLL